MGLSSYSYLHWLTCGQDSGASPSVCTRGVRCGTLRQEVQIRGIGLFCHSFLLLYLFLVYGAFKMMRFFLNGLVASSFLLSKKDLIGFFASRHHCASRRKKAGLCDQLELAMRQTFYFSLVCRSWSSEFSGWPCFICASSHSYVKNFRWLWEMLSLLMVKVRLNGVVAGLQQLLVTEVTAARFLPTIN